MDLGIVVYYLVFSVILKLTPFKVEIADKLNWNGLFKEIKK